MGSRLPTGIGLHTGRVLRVLACALLLAPCAAAALQVPPLKGRINDYAGILSPEAERRIEAASKQLEESDSTQVVVLTVPALDGDSIEDFSIRVAERWKIGRKGFDNGVILVVARDDRKVRIEVGYGLEGRLTDLMSGRIIRDREIDGFDLHGISSRLVPASGITPPVQTVLSGGYRNAAVVSSVPSPRPIARS